MNLIDTHCHIHESDYPLDREEVLTASTEAGVTKIICVGTSLESSREAIEFASRHDDVFATIGVHPHEAKDGIKGLAELITAGPGLMNKVVGVGEIGLDYYYNHSPREVQIKALNQQIELALKHDLPISFHVRDAFDDFWSIFDNFHDIKGVLHSYTDNTANLEKALSRGLFIGVNGIATFNKNPEQRAMYKAIPLESMLLETDAPFLSPVPFRGKPNQSTFIPKIVDFLTELRGETYDEIAATTTKNAEKLFKI